MRRPKTLIDNVLLDRARRSIAAGTPFPVISGTLGLGERTLSRIAAKEQPPDARRQFVRCPGCGGLQLQPCRVCRDREPTEAAA